MSLAQAMAQDGDTRSGGPMLVGMIGGIVGAGLSVFLVNLHYIPGIGL